MSGFPLIIIRNLLLVSLVCLLPVLFSYHFSLNTLESSTREMVRIKGETVFHLIQTARFWNVRHGGVYVPKTKQTPSNPYLNIENKDIVTASGLELTLLNPAYMTRQLGELLKDSKVEIHLTSLKPLNPDNQPDDWERQALLSFQQYTASDQDLASSFTLDKLQARYRYMRPLLVDAPCMECHQQQGYSLGDIRGGLSVSFPQADIEQLLSRLKYDLVKAHIAAYGALWLIGAVTSLLITQLKTNLQQASAKQSELSNLAMTDELTGLSNRRNLLANYEAAFAKAEQQGLPLSVLMLDIDHFKQVNDIHGHQVGDEVLRTFAENLHHALRSGDLSGRYGGEEFMIVLKAPVDTALAVAERIRKQLEGLEFEGKHPFKVSVSVGIAELQQHKTESAHQLIQQADAALYRAKDSGRNCSLVANTDSF